jgi:hypothetical protein
MTIHFHAVFVDETGCEFGAGIEANSREEAWEKARENYPESRCVQLESPEDTRKREAEVYAHIARGGDYDDEGRPIYYGPDDWDEDDWEEDDEDDDEDEYDLPDPPRCDWL